MWSPHWGYFFWFFIHSSALSFDQDEQIDIETLAHLKSFWYNMCGVLPCPACSLHCFQNSMNEQFDFKTGRDYWEFTVNFHNKVNKSLDKIEFSYDDAFNAWNKQLKQYNENLNIDNFKKAFLPVYWNVIYLCAMTFNASMRSVSPRDDPRVEQKQLMSRFLTSVCHILPFRNELVTDNKIVKNVLLNVLNETPLENVSTVDNALETVVRMYNSVCLDFGMEIKTKEMLQNDMNIELSNTFSVGFPRAYQIHEEDQLRILNMQKQIELLTLDKEKKYNDNVLSVENTENDNFMLLNNNSNSDDDNDNNIWKSISIALIVFVVLMTVIMMFYYHLVLQRMQNNAKNLPIPRFVPKQ